MGTQHHSQADDLRARFKVPERGVFCHTARLRNSPPRLKLVLSDSAVKWATIASVHAQLNELEKEGFDESLLEEMRTFYRNRIKAQGCSVDF